MDKLFLYLQALGATAPLWLLWWMISAKAARNKRSKEIEQTWYARKAEENERRMD